MLEKTILQKKLVLLYFKDSECYHDELNDVALKTESSDYPKGHVSDVVYVLMNKDYKSYCTWFSNHNYIFGEDYIDYIAYLVCLRKYQNKKEVRFLFAYGNCQVKYTVDCIKRYFHQSCDYFIDFMPLQEVCSWTDKRFELLCSICDYFFFTKEQFVVRYRNLEEYIIEHNPDCKMIAFPCYEFRGYFPQTDENVLRRNPFDIIRDYYNPFHRADLFLNGLIDKGVPENEILRTILKESCFTDNVVQKTLLLSLKKLEVLDRISSIPIYNYVKDCFQTIRLFKDPCHFNEPLLKYVSDQLIKAAEIPTMLPANCTDIHVFTEIPIYPSVYERLGLKFDNSKLTLRKIDGIDTVTIEEYVFQYIAYIKNVKLLLSIIRVTNGTD